MGGKLIAADTLDGIRKMYEDEKNKSKLARMFGVSLTTVYKAIGKEDPTEQNERRREGMAKAADHMQVTIEQLARDLQTVPPNASYQQKAVVLGILSDKVERIDKRLEEAKHEDDVAAMPMPETIEALAGALRNDLRSISFVFNLGVGEDLEKEVRSVEKVTGQKIIDAEVLSLDDLDGE